MYSFDKSYKTWEESKKYFTGGEGSQGRTSLYPIQISHGKGSRIYDIDGNEYIDFMLGYGPLILGHSHPRLVKAICHQAEKALTHGFSHVGELELARKIVNLISSIEQVRFNNTGTEAVQAAVRMARAYTGKSKIIKFVGQYHGWVDNVLISGAATKKEQMGSYSKANKVLISKGQPESVLSDILVAQWNDLSLVEDLIKNNRGEIAAILTEPMMTNAQIITPEEGYLQGLRQIADENDILLIFDEVVSGFRISLKGGQGYFNVNPDITVFGKALGGGVPISCIGASKEIMAINNKEGAIHLGTFNSNPLVVAAGNAVVDELTEKQDEVFSRMYRLGEKLKKGILEIFSQKGFPIRVQGTESLFAVMFVEQEVKNFAETFNINIDILAKYKKELYQRGIITRPELRDIWYFSTAHTDADIDEALNIINDAAKAIQ